MDNDELYRPFFRSVRCCPYSRVQIFFRVGLSLHNYIGLYIVNYSLIMKI